MIIDNNKKLFRLKQDLKKVEEDCKAGLTLDPRLMVGKVIRIVMNIIIIMIIIIFITIIVIIIAMMIIGWEKDYHFYCHRWGGEEDLQLLSWSSWSSSLSPLWSSLVKKKREHCYYHHDDDRLRKNYHHYITMIIIGWEKNDHHHYHHLGGGEDLHLLLLLQWPSS